MKRRFTDDQLLDLFLEMVNKKQTQEDFCTQHLISSKELLRLRRRFNAKHASEAKRNAELKKESSRLERELAEKTLQIAQLQNQINKIRKF